MSGAKLFPYQEHGRDFLAGRARAYLADDMGLGKTFQTIAAADKVNALRILIVCPATLKYNWQNEFKRWQTRKRSVALVVNPKAPLPDTDVIIANYEQLLNQKVFNQLSVRKFDLVVFDEAHRLKTHNAQRTRRALGPHANGTNGVAGQATRVWWLSGTPMPNDASELFTACKFMLDVSENFWTFRLRYCVLVQTAYGMKIVGARNVNDLKGKLGLFMLRRTAEQVLKDLPALMFGDIALDIAGSDVEKNNTAWLKLVEELHPDIGSLNDEDLLSLFKQSSVHLGTLRRLIGIAKAPTVAAQVVQELEDGLDKIILFAWHREVIDILAAELRDYKPQIITGSTSIPHRQMAVERFQTDPTCRVFIGNIQAAGEGLTLTAANHVLFAEQSWVPKDNLQAAKRAHRIGQTKPVLVRFASYPGTVDDIITKAVSRKTALISELIEESIA